MIELRGTTEENEVGSELWGEGDNKILILPKRATVHAEAQEHHCFGDEVVAVSMEEFRPHRRYFLQSPN